MASGSGWTEFELTDGEGPIPQDTPVEFQTDEMIYLGHAENPEGNEDGRYLRVRTDHALSIRDVSSIQKLWAREDSN